MNEEREVRTVRMVDLVDALKAAKIHARDCPDQPQTYGNLCNCWVKGYVDLRLIVNG
jgi:hypothetical protein